MLGIAILADLLPHCDDGRPLRFLLVLAVGVWRPANSGRVHHGDTPATALAVRPNAIEFARQGRRLSVAQMHGGVIAESLPDTLQIGRRNGVTCLGLTGIGSAEGETKGLGALAGRHENEAIAQRDCEFDTDYFTVDISRDALSEPLVLRPVPAHRPNNLEQQCYTPLLHSRGQCNTLEGLIYLYLFAIQNCMVPRKGLGINPTNYSKNSHLPLRQVRRLYHWTVLVSTLL